MIVLLYFAEVDTNIVADKIQINVLAEAVN